MDNMRRFILLLAAVCTSPAVAIFLEPSTAPAERLIRNMEAYIAKHPRDPKAYYLLGRIHYHVFATRQQTLRHYGKEPVALAFDNPGSIKPAGTTLPYLPEKVLAQHWLSAVENIRKAHRLQHADGLYDLTLGCLHEEMIPLRKALGLYIHLSEQGLRRVAIAHYAAAFTRSAPADAKLKELPSLIARNPPLSIEAAHSYLRLAPNGPFAIRMRIHLATLAKLPKSFAITPIILTLRPSAAGGRCHRGQRWW